MITTKNPTWGFYGTLVQGGADPDQAAALFDEAARALVRRFELSEDEARDVLDSRIGRHMADQRGSGEGAGDLVARLCARRSWERDIRRTIRELRGEPEPKSAPRIRLPVEPDEVPVLTFALEHALWSISEAHPEDRAKLKALLERLEAAEKAVRR